MAVDLTIHLKANSKKELQGASNVLEFSLTLKTQFKLIRKQDYKQRDGFFGQTRFYEAIDNMAHYATARTSRVVLPK